VAVCQFIPPVCVWGGGYLSGRDQIGTHTTHRRNELTQPHTDTLYNKCKLTFQLSNLAKYGHGTPEDGFKGD
jgi:hypothetical protein